MDQPLPVGKLPVQLLERLLSRLPVQDPRLVVGPGIGMDCAVIDAGPNYFVLKTDPITFASEEIGWYLVQINANDLATTGATPRWLMVTLLLPDGQTTPDRVEQIIGQIAESARSLGISVIGGHSEVTHGLHQTIAVGTLIGEADKDRLVTPRGIAGGDRVLLTKSIPIEAISILAREFPEKLHTALSAEEITLAAEYLHDPGIGVLRDAQIALRTGKVTAMHDPTEGGLASALWELAKASGKSLVIDLAAVPISDLAARICRIFDLDPLAAIASGALLITASNDEAKKVQKALDHEGIPCTDIGYVEDGSPAVWSEIGSDRIPLMYPTRDEIARLFNSNLKMKT